MLSVNDLRVFYPVINATELCWVSCANKQEKEFLYFLAL